MSVDIRNRLQPALLDRLSDDPRADAAAADGQRLMSRQQLRDAVLRDLSALFNAIQPLGDDAQAYPVLADSVLNFGLPSFSGRLASEIDVGALEAAIRQAIVRFEPRILPDTLRIRAVEADNLLETHNVVEIEIRGQLWSQPVPLEILLRTRLNLEAGQVEVRDAAGAPAAALRRRG